MVGGGGFTASSQHYFLSLPILGWQTTRSGVLYMDNKIKGFQNTFPPPPNFNVGASFREALRRYKTNQKATMVSL